MDNSTEAVSGAGKLKCTVCEAAMQEVYQATILGKYLISYFQCDSCGFLRTETPYWLDEAYSSAIAASDTGLISRNFQVARGLASLLFLAFRYDGKGRWLDYAGGYGMLTRLMRDKGFDFYWSDKHATNLFAQEFEHKEGAIYDGVTAVEVLEHTEDPVAFLANILHLSRTRTAIVTTELYPSPLPRPEEWWYFGLNTGQHVAFFQRRTLEAIAARLGVRYMCAGNFHVFSEQLPSTALARMASGRLSVFVDLLARRRLGSRVVSDHKLIAESQKTTREP